MNDRQMDDDTLIMVTMGVLALTFGWIPIGAIFEPVRTWMVDHQLLVHADAALVTIPGWEAGLDMARLALIGLVLLLLIVLAVLFKRSITARRQQ